MKLSKKDRKQLEAVLEQLTRAQNYITSPRVTGIAVESKHPNGASYSTSKECASMFHDGVQSIDVMNKWIGSDITGLYNAHNLLSALLSQDA